MATPGTILLIGAAAALGYYAVKGRRKATPEGQAPAGGGGGTNGGTPDPDPSPDPGGTGNYVGGSPTYSWPHKGMWPTAKSLFEWLRDNGYSVNVNGNYRGTQNKAAVKLFQQDYNAVRQATVLTADSKLGNGTVNAMYDVQMEMLPAAGGATWKQIVAVAKGGGGGGGQQPPPPSGWGTLGNVCVATVDHMTDHTDTGSLHAQLTPGSHAELKSAIKNHLNGPTELLVADGRGEWNETHKHTVVVSEAQKKSLSKGNAVMVATDTYKGIGPDHNHTMTLKCSS